jgi:hypothetical protein
METDCENGDLAAGRFLRVKVRLDIQEPLWRGIVVEVGEGGVDRWCPLQYEYLPDFYYVCGIIGHTDKTCSQKLAAGEKALFNKDLRYIPPRKKFGGEMWRGQEHSRWGSGRSGGLGPWNQKGTGSGGSGGTSRSDSLSWRKDSGNENQGKLKKGEEAEVNSPSKTRKGMETEM